MSKNTNSRTLSHRELARFHDADPGAEISIPVRVEAGEIEVATDDNHTVQVSGGDENGDNDELNDGKYRLQGTIETYVVGVNDDTDYLVLRSLDDLEFVHGLDPGSNTSNRSDEYEWEEWGSDSGSSNASVGKEVRKDRGEERITGKNPFADPQLIKETGLHQGGN